MDSKSKIEWTDATWNPVTGCTKVSPGCKNCYAERWSARTRPGVPFTEIHLHSDRLEQPLHWRKSKKIFVNSMSDLFHEDIPFDFIDSVFQVMARTWWHTYQILTKRPAEMLQYFDSFACKPNYIERMGAPWPFKNVWLGVSCEDQERADHRIRHLLRIPAAIHFVSLEPLLGPIILPKLLKPLDWVIIGGESGPYARPMHPDWARSIRDQCQAAGVPFFFKQWGEWGPNYVDGFQGQTISEPSTKVPCGGYYCTESIGHIDCCTHLYKLGKTRAGHLLDGREWNEYPDIKS